MNLVTQGDQNGLQEGQRSEWAHVYANREKGKETANYVIHNELLFRVRLTDSEPGEATLRLCVPKALREDVLRACHDDVLAGHLGRNRAYDKVQQRYFWQSLAHDLERYVKSCKKCQSRKRGVYKKPPGFL